MFSPRVRGVAVAAVVLVAAGCTSQGSSPTPSGPAMTPPQPPVSTLPEPDPRTPAPAGSVTAEALLRSDDLPAPAGGAWQEGATTDRSPERPSAACQRSRWESFGPGALHVREFAGPGGSRAASVVMSFADAQRAAEAVATLDEWWRTCGDVVKSNGGSDVTQALPTAEIPLDGARALQNTVGWKTDGAAVYERHLVVARDARVAVVTLQGAAPGATDALTPVARRAAERLTR